MRNVLVVAIIIKCKEKYLFIKQNPMTKRFLYKLGLITQEELKNDLG